MEEEKWVWVLKINRERKIEVTLKIVSSKKVWYGGVVMGILLSLVESAILYGAFNISPL
jgi:hypothetical protein